MHASNSPLFALCLLTALAQAACAPSVPDNPSWEEDVKPIMAANCVRCHRAEPQNGAPSTFRLDACEAAGDVDGTAARIASALSRAQNDQAPMPPAPAARLSDRQIEVLQNWFENGAPCTGTASAAPSFVLLRAIEESVIAGASPAADELVVRYAVDDHGATPLRATLLAVSSAGETHVAPERPLAAQGELRWSLDEVPAGAYELFVALDDGARVREVRAGTFHIPAAGERR